jgi:hypothetical protein
VVLAGNIGKFSLLVRPRGEGHSLQNEAHVTDDDLDAFGRWEATKRSTAGPELILCPKSVRARKRNTTVTIYHGTDCKLDDDVVRGELLGR